MLTTSFSILQRLLFARNQNKRYQKGHAIHGDPHTHMHTLSHMRLLLTLCPFRVATGGWREQEGTDRWKALELAWANAHDGLEADILNLLSSTHSQSNKVHFFSLFAPSPSPSSFFLSPFFLFLFSFLLADLLVTEPNGCCAACLLPPTSTLDPFDLI